MPSTITQLIQDIAAGDRTKCDGLFKAVYDDFRRVAHRHLAGEADDVLQTSELVHEAYLRLIDHQKVGWKGRAHFLAVGSRVIRQILVDEARKRKARKRGGDMHRISLEISERPAKVSRTSIVDVLAVDAALSKLADFDERQAQIIELRFFGGMTVEETAEALGVSDTTVERQWRLARAWLRLELSSDSIG